MAVCRQYGISHSHYMGGKARWTELDRKKAQAYEIVLKEMCPKCGTLPEDWQDQDTNRLHDRPVWAAVPRRCYGCQDLELIREKMPTGKKGAGGYVALVPFDMVEDGDLEIVDTEVVRVEQENQP